MKITVINGPNLNLLGVREPDVYGRESYADLCRRIKQYAGERGVEIDIFQSNHEGDLIDRIQAAAGRADGIVLNPAAYAHTSVALLDALLAVRIPTVEVHISDVAARESFRRTDYVRAACLAAVIGHGTDGYLEAIDLLLEHNHETAH